MSRNKNPRFKIRLAKLGKRTRWAPIFSVLRRYGLGKRVHPSELTRIKRNWRRRKIQEKLKRIDIKKIKSGKKKKKY